MLGNVLKQMNPKGFPDKHGRVGGRKTKLAKHIGFDIRGEDYLQALRLRRKLGARTWKGLFLKLLKQAPPGWTSQRPGAPPGRSNP